MNEQWGRGVRSDLQKCDDGRTPQNGEGGSGSPLCAVFLREAVDVFVEDEVGHPQDIAQEEGGEQGDLLMPLLFALGLYGALSAVKDRFRADEKVFAFLDDVRVEALTRAVPAG